MATRTIANGGGNWSSTSTWVEAAVPTSSDDVVATATSGNLTIDATSNCRSLDFTNYVGTLTWNNQDLNIGTSSLPGSNVAVKYVAGMTISTTGGRRSHFVGTAAGTGTVTCGGQDIGTLEFNGAGGTWSFQDTLSANGGITLTTGTLNTNNQTCTWGSFASQNTNTRTLTMGSSSITINGTSSNTWQSTASAATGLTVSSNTATITFSGAAAGCSSGAISNWNGASLVFSNAGSSGQALNAAGTMANLTITGAASKSSNFSFTSLGNTVTITGTLTLTANSATNALLIQTGTVGSSLTLNAAIVVASNRVDFMDITGAGAATWSSLSAGASVYFGDCGGNSGITFDPGLTATWSGNTTGNWSGSNWTISGSPNQDPNPSFETDTSSWSGFVNTGSLTITRITTDARRGTACAQYAVTGASSGGAQAFHNSSSSLAVSPGQTVALRFSTKATSGNGTSITLNARYYTSGGSFLSQPTLQTVSSPTANTWYDFSGTSVAPASAATVSVEITWNGITTPSFTFLVDAAFIEIAGSVPGYSDNIARVPLPQDSVAISGLTSGTVTADMPRVGGTVDFTGSSGGTITNSVNTQLFGSLTYVAGLTVNWGPVTVQGRGNYTITSAGKNGCSTSFTISAPTGTYTLQDNFMLSSSRTLQVTNGTLDAATNNVNVSVGLVVLTGTATRALNMGSGVWTVTGTSGVVWNVGTTGLTLNVGTSTIVISDTGNLGKSFSGGGLTYNNLSITGGGTGAITLTLSNTFNTLMVNAPKTITFTHGTTTTIRDFYIIGYSGNLVTIVSDSNGSTYTLALTGLLCDFASWRDATVTSGAIAYAGANSTNVSGNSGLTFTAPVSELTTGSVNNTPGISYMPGIA